MKKVKVFGTITTEVVVEPIQVIEALLNEHLDNGDYIDISKGGKCIIRREVSAGTHSYYKEEEIDESLHSYIGALYNVKHFLKSQKG